MNTKNFRLAVISCFIVVLMSSCLLLPKAQFASASEESYAEVLIESSSEAGIMPYSTYSFLDITILNKSGSTWNIRVSNDTTSPISFVYNYKRCFKNDAQTWTNLNDLRTAYVSAGSSITISIVDNGIGDYIAVSWLSQGKRMVTYGYNMNEITKTMTVEYIVIGQ